MLALPEADSLDFALGLFMTMVSGKSIVIVEVGPEPLTEAEFARIIAELPALPPRTHYVFDLSRLQRISARAISRLTMVCKVAHAHSVRVHLVGLNAPLRALIGLIRLDRLFRVHADRAELCNGLRIDPAQLPSAKVP